MASDLYAQLEPEKRAHVDAVASLVGWIIPRVEEEHRETAMYMLLEHLNAAQSHGLRDAEALISSLVDASSGQARQALTVARDAIAKLRKLNLEVKVDAG